MAFELNGFSDAILKQLSNISIEIMPDRTKITNEELIPKAIYEISKNIAKNIKPSEK